MSPASAPVDAHRFCRLTDGVCHFRVDGPVDGPPLLMLHGATVPHWEFDRLAPLLNAAGLRTIRPDLYGHGYSDRPRTDYVHGLFVRQALELLAALEVVGPVRLLGHSLGAAIAARIVLAAPGLVSRMVLGAPLVDYTENVAAARLLALPLLGESLMHCYVVPMLARRRARNYRLIEDGRFVAKFRRQLARPGFGRALLSMFRCGALGAQGDAYRALAGRSPPLLVLRGAEDRICPPAQFARLRAWLPGAAFQEMEGTGHAFMLTHPERVAPLLLDFLLRD
jgi:pimeloyl-ACP methyl ester carboxylesterase